MNRSQLDQALVAGIVAGKVASGDDSGLMWTLIALFCFTNPWGFGLLVAFLTLWGVWSLLKAIGRLLLKGF